MRANDLPMSTLYVEESIPVNLGDKLPRVGPSEPLAPLIIMKTAAICEFHPL